jgi:hypothetical protein
MYYSTVSIAIVEKKMISEQLPFQKIHLHNIVCPLSLEVARLLRDDPTERLFVDSEV